MHVWEIICYCVCVRNYLLLDKIHNGIGGAFVRIIFSFLLMEVVAAFQWDTMNKLIYFNENAKLLTRNQKQLLVKWSTFVVSQPLRIF